MVGGNAGEVLETFGIAMHGRWLRLYVSHTWEDNALQSLVMVARVGHFAFTMDMGVFSFTCHGITNRK